MPKVDWRPSFHIQPPIGWLNDPNGSCWYDGKYHIFFQYSPDEVRGGKKYWGHYESVDLVNFKFKGIVLSPDKPFDCDGVYSGTAWVENGELELYYTGNVKHKGDYDYINEGRGHNVVRVKTSDTLRYSEKELLLENHDYPENLSCHVRDPKIFKMWGEYYMLLGARTRDSVGTLLFMKSKDRDNWKTDLLFTPSDDFGYMLECPDFFTLVRKNGQTGVISFCPQGMDAEEFRYQNIYQSGYCLLSDELITAAKDGLDDEMHVQNSILNENIRRDHFHEWDMGFDFYAPQVFEAPDGRRLIIGWAGVPDAPYTNETTVKNGWQHCMTMIRELELKNGRIYQTPAHEYDKLHEKEMACDVSEGKFTVFSSAWDLTVEFDKKAEHREIHFFEDLSVEENEDGVSLIFHNDTGEGRDRRNIKNIRLENLRILFDESIMEIYINNGEEVMTTRYYPRERLFTKVNLAGAKSAKAFSMRQSIEINED